MRNFHRTGLVMRLTTWNPEIHAHLKITTVFPLVQTRVGSAYVLVKFHLKSPHELEQSVVSGKTV
ncbi:hypothetical protein Mapa_013053 [Marchantia paleacea]|nr:hypothetical protein Mapa_013053 [Marchantia paleacea]